MMNRFPLEYIEAYKLIGTFRGFQAAIADRYSQQMMRCPVHLSIGQEYWLPLVRYQVQSGDRYFSSHRSHSMYMALGGDFERLIAELHGHENGCLAGRGGSMHLKDISVGLEQSVPIVGSSVGLALGSALAAQRNRQGVLTVSYFGDGGCEEGIIHESLNMAHDLSLPILFICENNSYSCNTHVRRRQSSSNMSRIANAHGIASVSINQTLDYKDLSERVSHAFELARSKPCFLEVFSYRLYEHCGNAVDSETGDRTEEEYIRNLKLDHFELLQAEYKAVRDSYDAAFSKYTAILDKYSYLNQEAIFS